MLTRYNGAHHLHPAHPGDVRDDVMQLHIHLHQGFLHMLDVRGRIFYQAFSLPQVSPQSRPLLSRLETAAQ
jgi:hypothetical protein